MNSDTPSTVPQDMPPRLRLREITKRFPGCLANDAVSLDLAPGEIHALLGENGAGKSTLVKILYGVQGADSGTIEWEGQNVDIPSPSAARPWHWHGVSAFLAI